MPLHHPCLWIVATPIGNPGDLSNRACEILSSVDCILAEDTRRALKLLNEHNISPKKLESFYEHNEIQKIPHIVKNIQDGLSIALISDAGTPLLSDPGYRLVRECRKKGIKVSPVPGPSAPVTALCASGIAPLPYSFLGFLPRQGKSARDLFTAYKACPGSIIFFERKDRLPESLEMAYMIFGNRELAICRELTKPYEEFIIGHLEDGSQLAQNLLGELTIVIGPPITEDRTPVNEVIDILKLELNSECKPRQAAQNTKNKCAGWSVSEIYALIPKIK